MKVYVASSWRNEARQQEVVKLLLELGHEVYDFRNPPDGEVTGFHWSEIDDDWENWTAAQAAEALKHPVAQENYGVDRRHLDWCDICVLVLPCGKSAHLEAGYAAGAGKTLITYLSDGDPELMHLMSGWIVTSLAALKGLFSTEWPKKTLQIPESYILPAEAQCENTDDNARLGLCFGCAKEMVLKIQKDATT